MPEAHRRVALRRKRDAVNANPSYLLYADSPQAIDLDLLENLDTVVVQEWRVEDAASSRPSINWIDEERYRATLFEYLSF